MENTNQSSFSILETKDILDEAMNKYELVYSEDKTFVAFDDKKNLIYKFVPPFFQKIEKKRTIKKYYDDLQVEYGKYMFVLIQAQNAALAIYDKNSFTYHKVISKYMVRQKRGKAQITYLNQKGKSRGGGKMRLRNTIAFFNEINQKLTQWEDEIMTCEKIFYSCPVRLWGEIFRAKCRAPVEKTDDRWTKIPLDVNIPNFKEIRRVFYKLTHGAIYRKNDLEI